MLPPGIVLACRTGAGPRPRGDSAHKNQVSGSIYYRLENAVSLFRTKNLDNMVDSTQSPGGLKKVLGPMDLILMGIGAIVGTGIFVLTGTGALTAGPALTMSFIVAAIACGFAAMCYAEFATALPVAGSAYVFTYATMGELLAWIIGWNLILELLMAAAVIAKFWGVYLSDLFSVLDLDIPSDISLLGLNLTWGPLLIVAI